MKRWQVWFTLPDVTEPMWFSDEHTLRVALREAAHAQREDNALYPKAGIVYTVVEVGV